MDKVSVIIPTYNRFKYLLNTLQSIKNQTYKNIEIIIVNDGSTQKEYYDYNWSDIKIIHLKSNSKTIFGYVRNQGINISTGKYIAFCDDDDIWFPQKISLQIDSMTINNCKMSSTDGLSGNGIYDPNKIYKKYNAEECYNEIQNIYKSKGSSLLDNGFPSIWTLDFIKIHNCIICSSVLIEKEILNLINNFKNVKPPGEDYDCWLRALEYTNCVYIEEICFYYDNKHADGQNYIDTKYNITTYNIPILKLQLNNLNFAPNIIQPKYFNTQSNQQFIEYFLPNNLSYEIIADTTEKSNIKIWDIQLANNELLLNTDINILISVENCLQWTWYSHYNKFGNYGNNRMDIYFYNHINKIVHTDKYLAIPLIHSRINYYQFNKEIIKPLNPTHFTDKKFCLTINRSKLNTEINHLTNLLELIDQVDNIELHTDIILNKSCYNSPELLNIFSQYKFIICYENSYAPGYITEKIFNCFFAQTIPIYKGSPIIEQYINISSFIDARNINKAINLIKKLNSNESTYNDYISEPKISPTYSDENYQQIFKEFISKKLNKNNQTNDYINEDDLVNWINANSGILHTRKISNINKINLQACKPNTLVCLSGYNHIIEMFFTKFINQFKFPIILITLETDYFEMKYEYINHPNIAHWFTWNKSINHNKLTCIPIGLNHDRQVNSINTFFTTNKQIKKTKLLCINCSLETNSSRSELLDKVKNEWSTFCHILPTIPYSQNYFNNSNVDGQIKIQVTDPKCYELISQYKFILSPEGAGLDCHRTWEALYLGVIPIVLDSTISEIYQDLPILVIDTWDMITEDFLNTKYTDIYKKKQTNLYQMNKLNLEYWINLIKEKQHINQIHFITYANDVFAKAKSRLLHQAKQFYPFETIQGYGPSDLSVEFTQKFANILNMKRGAGYWIWKPIILKQKLDQMQNDEMLVYLDAGCNLNPLGMPRFLEYINMLKTSDYGILSFQMSGRPDLSGNLEKEICWTTTEIFNYFNIDPDSEIGKSGQYSNTCFILKKNKHLMDILDIFIKALYDNVLLFTDYYNNEKQNYEFKENRHEQSVFSIIRKIYGSIIIDGDESWHVPFGDTTSLKYPFWATRSKV